MESYSVSARQKAPLVAFVAEALESSGFTIDRLPDPNIAPFVFAVSTPWGEPLDLICYLFFANKYRGEGRPSDEHRFQVKYGQDFSRLHELFIAQGAGQLTLMFGVHLEEKVFVAVDPSMHNPTWFSRSVEFKTAELQRIQRDGWVGWERERSKGRRRFMPQENYQTEVLLGFRPERFGDYVLLERQCSGIPPGERLLAIEDRLFHHDELHSLEMTLGLSKTEIMNAISKRFRLHVAMRGAAAEVHLHRLLLAESRLGAVKELDQDGKPDFEVDYLGRTYRIECKNTLRKLQRNSPKLDFQKTRSSKGDPCSRYYRPEQFEILAACLHPVTAKWEFRFCPTRSLPLHSKCPGHLSQHVLVENGDWTDSIVEALDSVPA